MWRASRDLAAPEIEGTPEYIWSLHSLSSNLNKLETNDEKIKKAMKKGITKLLWILKIFFLTKHPFSPNLKAGFTKYIFIWKQIRMQVYISHINLLIERNS